MLWAAGISNRHFNVIKRYQPNVGCSRFQLPTEPGTRDDPLALHGGR